MVFMAVGQDHGPNLVFVPQEIAEIRNDDIDAQHIVFRKHQPGIDDQDLFSILEAGAY